MIAHDRRRLIGRPGRFSNLSELNIWLNSSKITVRFSFPRHLNTIQCDAHPAFGFAVYRRLKAIGDLPAREADEILPLGTEAFVIEPPSLSTVVSRLMY